jgi:hypothetical protein
LKNTYGLYNKDNLQFNSLSRKMTNRDFYYYILNIEDYNLIISESWNKLSMQFHDVKLLLSTEFIDVENNIFTKNNILINELILLNNRINTNMSIVCPVVKTNFTHFIEIFL